MPMCHHWLGLAVTVLLAQDPAPSKTETDTRAIQGGWHCVAVWDDGKKIPAEDIPKFGFAIQFNAKGMMQINFPEFRASSNRFRLDGEANPKHIDMLDRDRDKKEPIYLGIYDLTDDELRLCMNYKKKERPKEFKSEAGGPRLYVLKRIKEGP
jgi:uncharacterized protein (TIGR03067 family)